MTSRSSINLPDVSSNSWIRIFYVGRGRIQSTPVITINSCSGNFIVGTGNEDQHRLYKCIHSQDRDINIRHVSTNVVLISSRSDRSLCDRIGYRADRAKWHPATYKYTATSKQRRRTSRTNVQSLEPVIPFYYSTH